ncbi:serine/threonine-protein kinase [Streptomyces sp. NPDC058067]|uniref:serine/threonine-protein kinase n=1 Tax=Streptomyces sp. NPDC058067 TaxID=3346324 RepID=UPI0036E7DFF8
MNQAPPDESDLRGLQGRVVDGRYALSEWIGGGGFGAVFRADQYILGHPVRSVACKLSRRSGLTEENAAELFQDVLLLAEAMDSMTDAEARRHLVHVYDGGLAQGLGGRAFLAMEYVPGATLAGEFAAMGRVPAPLMVKWARQICVALRGLHRLDPPLLHRDLKPDNVLLGSDNWVRLIDFGLAARMLELGHVPGTVGTLQYMAPETAAGSSVPESDLYSLGLLMYEGLTGRHAYAHLTPPPSLPDAAHGDWLQEQKQGAPPVRPSVHNNLVPPALDALVMRLLEPRPAQRHRSAQDVIAALDVVLDRPVVRQPGEADLEEARRLRAQRQWAAAAATLRRALARHDIADPIRLALLVELGPVHESGGDHLAAAHSWADACELVRGRALMPSGQDRARLARRAEEAFRKAGNRFQAERFARQARAERDRG